MNEKHSGIDFERMKDCSEEEFKGVLFDFASRYCSYLNIDFSRDVLPHLEDVNWWEADYGQASRDGKSIGMSAKDALKCLVDTHRTLQLYKGIRNTVEGLKLQGKTDIVGIDAGTGTGILAFIMLSQGVSKVNAIEVNKETFKVTKKFIDGMGLSDKIIMIEGDATKIDTPKLRDKKADILVSENLSTALLNEPQYDIINHLSNYLSPDAQIIPGGAELFASVAFANWDGVPVDKNGFVARRLKRCDVVSTRVKFFSIDSTVGMPNPTIESKFSIPTDYLDTINALLISTRFKINNLGYPVYLEPDTAEFLGKTFAFRLGGNTYSSEGVVNVSLKYEAGRERVHLKSSVDENNINLFDTMLK